MKCHNCGYNRARYIQPNGNKKLHGIDKGKWKRDNFEAHCSECGWRGRM